MNIFKILKNFYQSVVAKRKLRKRLKEMKKNDPFIY